MRIVCELIVEEFDYVIEMLWLLEYVLVLGRKCKCVLVEEEILQMVVDVYVKICCVDDSLKFFNRFQGELC